MRLPTLMRLLRLTDPAPHGSLMAPHGVTDGQIFGYLGFPHFR